MSSTATKRTLEMLAVVVDGLEVIQGLTKVGGAKAALALASIERIIDRLRDGFNDPNIDPKAIMVELDTLRAQLISNNEAADRKLAEKFDHSTD